MILKNKILAGLTTEQEMVCQTMKNIYLTACPGSGKTFTLTRRLAYLASSHLSRKWNIAITYTNRAAEEIATRLHVLGINQVNIWTGTIHQFCLKFIIRPYSMYSQRLSKGYKIIDEYVQNEYWREIAKKLGHNLNLYDDPFSFEGVKDLYLSQLESRKEIDFDQILQFSEELVYSMSFISENIASILNSILVDEFQDTNEIQYRILAKIFKANKKISLLFVGDVNQAIFGTLGGIAKSKCELESMLETNFDKKSLTGCYRSTQNIIDFYKNFEIESTGVNSVASIKNEIGKLKYCFSTTEEQLPKQIALIINSELDSGVSPEEICVVAPQWALLFNLTPKLREMLPTVLFDAPDISPIKYDPLNPFFLISRLVFTKPGQNVAFRKKIVLELITILKDDYEVLIPKTIDYYSILLTINLSVDSNEDGLYVLQNSIKALFKLLKIQVENEKKLIETQLHFFNKIDDRINRYKIPTDYLSISKFFNERKGVVLSTVHGIKGEEYTTVIAFALLNGIMPNWNFILKDELKPRRLIDTKKLLYVLCSRAKKNIYLFSEQGRKTKKDDVYTPTDELLAVINKISMMF